jgi:hypothetical protein
LISDFTIEIIFPLNIKGAAKRIAIRITRISPVILKNFFIRII